jgi:hypothetical protein
MRSISFIICVGCLAGALGACEETVGGNQPVGGDVDTDAEIQRFLRRAYLDLTGSGPSDADLTASTTRLREAGNTPAARGELVAELVAKPAFTKVWVEELENGIFGGLDLDQHYKFVCSLVRADPACSSCTQTDSCLCTCPSIATLKTQRDLLMMSASDLMAGTSTSEVESRYALQSGYYALAGTPEGRVRALFDDFLSRAPEPDEIENGRSMVIFQDGFLNNSAVAFMFHRHGGSYADMITIIFESEVYREAMVRRAFERYLARTPTPVELAHFTATLDAMEPDMRLLVRAVVSSREYFSQ